MLNFLPGPVRGVLGVVILIGNTLFWGIPVYITALFKLALPFKAPRLFFDTILNRLSYTWMYCNNSFIDLLKKVEYDVQGLEDLEPDEWYLVISNHQTWVDIIALQKIFHNRIPFLKYFLKKELIWIPILGLAWWALDYPFMKRYTKEYLKKHPHRKGRDIEATRKACGKFKDKPASLMNFVEGTRFTPEKHSARRSPYRYLLEPRSGGIAFVLSAMGGYMRKILDVTIVYPDGAPDTWEFLCSKRTRIVVRIEVLPIDKSLVSDDPDDPGFRGRINSWLNALWMRKDGRMDRIIYKYRLQSPEEIKRD